MVLLSTLLFNFIICSCGLYTNIYNKYKDRLYDLYQPNTYGGNFINKCQDLGNDPKQLFLGILSKNSISCIGIFCDSDVKSLLRQNINYLLPIIKIIPTITTTMTHIITTTTTPIITATTTTTPTMPLTLIPLTIKSITTPLPLTLIPLTIKSITMPTMALLIYSMQWNLNDLEYIVNAKNTPFDKCNTNILGNVIMSYSVWNKQIGKKGWYYIEHEKMAVYGSKIFCETVKNIVKCDTNCDVGITIKCDKVKHHDDSHDLLIVLICFIVLIILIICTLCFIKYANAKYTRIVAL